MGLSAANILNVAGSEARTGVRLVRFWVAAIVIALISGVGYTFACLSLSLVAPYTPSIATPFYLLGSIEPTFFLMFQLVVLLMVFDSPQQQSRNRIDEVLNSKPVSNLEYFAGRTLGYTFLLWIFAAALILTAHGFGLIAALAGFGFGEAFQMHSLFNLLVFDLPAMLFIWCAFTVFLSSVLRVRVAALGVGALAIFAWMVLLLESSYAMRAIVSPSSNDVLFISDVLPEFPKLETLLVRFGTVCGAIGLTVVASVLHRRRDSSSLLSNFSSIGVAAVLCVSAIVFAAVLAFTPASQNEKWLEAHKSITWNGDIDVKEISGIVHIDPGRSLEIDVLLKVESRDLQLNSLVFSFNPSMSIDNIELDGNPTNYSFENGLLQIPVDGASRDFVDHELRVQAKGIPDPRFAYFDGAVDYLNENDVPSVAASLVGTDGAVFTRRYVALMPGAHWYPTPGPVNNDYEAAQRGFDYFRVNLVVHLSRSEWTLVAHGSELDTESSTGVFNVAPEKPVHEVALFASNFVSSSLIVDDLKFEMHLHKRHLGNLLGLRGKDSEFAAEFENRIDTYTGKGLAIAHQEMRLVEVPRRLRTVRGGWNMGSANSLPGIVMLKEHGFPRARIDLAYQRVAEHYENEQERAGAELSFLHGFFNSAILTENIWMGLPNRFWSHTTTAQGRHAQSLDQVVLSLMGRLFNIYPRFSTFYSTLYISELTNLNPDRTVWAAEDVGRYGEIYVRSNDLASVNYFGSRPSVWSNMERVSLAEFPSGNGAQHDLEVMHLKSSKIASGLLAANEEKELLAWILSVQRDFAGRNYTLEDLVAAAKNHGIKFEPFLTDWLETSRLAGLKASGVSNTRLKDDENGNPQWVASVNLRNMEPSPGVAVIQYSFNEPNPRIRPNFQNSEAFFVDGESARLINLITSDQVAQARMSPALSLNRGPWALAVNTIPGNEPTDMDLPPVFEDSRWTPAEDGIVVDDLSPGFRVFQSESAFSEPVNMGPASWFREPFVKTDIDAGLPVQIRRRGIWSRRDFHLAYGEYRKTTAEMEPGRNTLPTVRFTAVLPESSTWKLEYHLPYHDEWFPSGREYKYLLVVNNKNDSWKAELDGREANQGWNVIDEFELEGGPVDVDVVGVSQTWRHRRIYADAVRWSKIESN